MSAPDLDQEGLAVPPPAPEPTPAPMPAHDPYDARTDGLDPDAAAVPAP
ncbi:MAG TPA: hypothetical protein VM286_07635 [Candidatus Thermoplasmatota archaeon]|nr:hypothetical protein [Candidatus Thermoplasmatota archaeon]